MTDITFDHVMVGLLNIKTNHHTYKTLRENGLSDAYDIICLTKEIIDCLIADDVDDNGDTIMKDKPITLYNRFRIRNVVDFFRLKIKENNGILEELEILAITKEQWYQYAMEVPALNKKENINYNSTGATHNKKHDNWYGINGSPKYKYTVQNTHLQNMLQQRRNNISINMKNRIKDRTKSFNPNKQPTSKKVISTATVVTDIKSVSKENNYNSSPATSVDSTINDLKLATRQFQQGIGDNCDVNVHATTNNSLLQSTDIDTNIQLIDENLDVITDVDTWCISMGDSNITTQLLHEHGKLYTKGDDCTTIQNSTTNIDKHLGKENLQIFKKQIHTVQKRNVYNNINIGTQCINVKPYIKHDINMHVTDINSNTIRTNIRTGTRNIIQNNTSSSKEIKQILDNKLDSITHDNISNHNVMKNQYIYGDHSNDQKDVHHININSIYTNTVDGEVHDTLLDTYRKDSVIDNTDHDESSDQVHRSFPGRAVSVNKTEHQSFCDDRLKEVYGLDFHLKCKPPTKLDRILYNQNTTMLYINSLCWFPTKLQSNGNKCMWSPGLNWKINASYTLWQELNFLSTCTSGHLNHQFLTDGEIDSIRHSHNRSLIQSTNNILDGCNDIKICSNHDCLVLSTVIHLDIQGISILWKTIKQDNNNSINIIEYDCNNVDTYTGQIYPDSVNKIGMPHIKPIFINTRTVDSNIQEMLLSFNISHRCGILNNSETMGTKNNSVHETLQIHSLSHVQQPSYPAEYKYLMNTETPKIHHSPVGDRSQQHDKNNLWYLYKYGWEFICKCKVPSKLDYILYCEFIKMFHINYVCWYPTKLKRNHTLCLDKDIRVLLSNTLLDFYIWKNMYYCYCHGTAINYQLWNDGEIHNIHPCWTYGEIDTNQYSHHECWVQSQNNNLKVYQCNITYNYMGYTLWKEVTIINDYQVALSCSTDLVLWGAEINHRVYPRENKLETMFVSFDDAFGTISTSMLLTINKEIYGIEKSSLEPGEFCLDSGEISNMIGVMYSTCENDTTTDYFIMCHNILGTLNLMPNKHSSIITVGTKICNHYAGYDISSLFSGSESTLDIDVHDNIIFQPMLDHIAVSIIVFNTLHDPIQSAAMYTSINQLFDVLHYSM